MASSRNLTKILLLIIFVLLRQSGKPTAASSTTEMSTSVSDTGTTSDMSMSSASSDMTSFSDSTMVNNSNMTTASTMGDNSGVAGMSHFTVTASLFFLVFIGYRIVW